MTPPRRGARTKARKRALDVLFEADLRETDPETILARASGESAPGELTERLVRGYAENRADVDQRVSSALAPGWTLERMPRVDRCLARLGIVELDSTETPPDVVIAEMVRLASVLSTDESPAFLNGLLAKAAETRPAAPRSAQE